MSGDRGHLFFGVLHHLKNIVPSKNFAIIDRSIRTKNFFEKQQFVDFNKLYFYKESQSTFHDVDIEYLKKFEKKYNINLSQIIYSDPTFFPIYHNSKFNHKEILSLIEDDCKFYEKILEESKPDFLIIHVGGQKQLNLLTSMCKSIGIKILQFAPARFGKRFQISREYDVLDKSLPKNYQNVPIDESYLSKLKTDLDLYSFYHGSTPWGYNLSKLSFFVGQLKNITKMRSDLKNSYSDIKTSFVGNFFNIFKKNIKKIYRKRFLDKHTLTYIPKNEKFVFYSLHVQPEQTTSVQAPFVTDQINLIRNIAKSLPIDHFLYVKEHFSQGLFWHWRPIEYYKEILNMPNVRLFHPSINSSLLLANCSIVATITGSTGYEGMMYKKPIIVFADVGNMEIDSVFKVENFEELPKTIRDALKLQDPTLGYRDFFEAKLEESFDVDFLFFNDAQTSFYIANTPMDKIKIEDMASFLQRHEKLLKKVTDKFKNKIIQYENNTIM